MGLIMKCLTLEQACPILMKLVRTPTLKINAIAKRFQSHNERGVGKSQFLRYEFPERRPEKVSIGFYFAFTSLSMISSRWISEDKKKEERKTSN